MWVGSQVGFGGANFKKFKLKAPNRCFPLTSRTVTVPCWPRNVPFLAVMASVYRIAASGGSKTRTSLVRVTTSAAGYAYFTGPSAIVFAGMVNDPVALYQVRCAA